MLSPPLGNCTQAGSAAAGEEDAGLAYADLSRRAPDYAKSVTDGNRRFFQAGQSNDSFVRALEIARHSAERL